MPGNLNEFEQADQAIKQKLEQFIGSPITEEKKEEESPKEELKTDSQSTESKDNISEKPAENITPIEEKKDDTVEEKPEETTQVEIKTEEKKPETPAIDPEKLAETITQKVTDTLLTKMSGKTEAQLQEETGAQSPWAKENRNPKDWDEVANWMADIATQRIQKQMEEKETARKAEEDKKAQEIETKKQQEEQAEKQIQTYWNTQYKQLVDAGKITDTEDDKKELFKQLSEVNKKLIAEQKPGIYNLAEFMMFHYKAPKKDAPGGDAPISGKNTTVNNSSNDSYKYSEIRRAKSLMDLISGR